MRVVRAAVLGGVALLAPTALLRAQPAEPSAALDSVIRQHMASAGIMGVAAAVIVDKQVVWMRGFGYADYARTRPFTPATIMNVGSIAKTFTGVAMMRAVQNGQLSLDEDINRYLPFRVVNPHRPGAVITLRHLATHTSGITDRWAVYSRTYHYGGDAPEPLGPFLTQYFTPGGTHYDKENFLAAVPGQRREYSNIGAALAGYIVERAVGEPLNRYTRQHIFTPLGMTTSGWFFSEVDTTRHSTLFVSQNGHIIPIPPYSGVTYPDGGVRTSVAELSRFFIALLNGGAYQGARILDARQAAEMVRFQFSDANRPENLPATDGNSGLFWRTKFGGRRVGHGGNDPGLQTEMLADPSGRFGVVLFVNTSVSGEDGRAVAGILDAVWKDAQSRASSGTSGK
jgi:CubicO group peptidase (beta-lactamase class C family)